MLCMLGGIFAFRWLSYSVAGRGVVNPRGFAAKILYVYWFFSDTTCEHEKLLNREEACWVHACL